MFLSFDSFHHPGALLRLSNRRRKGRRRIRSRWRLLIKIGLDHVFRHVRRDRSMARMLRDHHHRNLWVFARSITYEPSMMPIIERQLRTAHMRDVGEVFHFGGTGLSRNYRFRALAPRRGPPRLVDHAKESLFDG